jgi:cell filamentation protein
VNLIKWRWIEKDFGFRFKTAQGRRTTEYYQGARENDFYVIPGNLRKLDAARLNILANGVVAPPGFRVISNPWRYYDRNWDWIETQDGICLNYAGCLDREEIDRREDEGVARAMEHVTDLVFRPGPAALTLTLIRVLHRELMGLIYPFAGTWRTVALHKGEGPTKWPLPPGGIDPLMDVLERDVLSRSPFLSDVDQEVYAYASEVMNEFLAIHPFREGNGRTAFVIGNLILMQNSLLPLNVYDRKNDEKRYFEACEAGRISKDYGPLARLIGEWEEMAMDRLEDEHDE